MDQAPPENPGNTDPPPAVSVEPELGKPYQVVYRLQQQVDLSQWVGPGEADTVEKYPRVGLMLLKSDGSSGRWWRSIQEYISSDEFLQTVKLKDVVPRDELQAKHEQTLGERTIEFGLGWPIEFDSDLAGADPALPFEPRPAVPFHLLYLPTLVPLKTGGAGNEAGSRGTMRVAWRGAEFNVGYEVKGAGVTIEGARKVQVTLEAKEVAFEFEGNTTWLKPEGSWVVEVSKENGLPAVMEGKFTVTVRSKFEDVFDLQTKEAVLETCRCAFKITRVPVSFDEENIYPKAWRLADQAPKIDIPEPKPWSPGDPPPPPPNGGPPEGPKKPGE